MSPCRRLRRQVFAGNQSNSDKFLQLRHVLASRPGGLAAFYGEGSASWTVPEGGKEQEVPAVRCHQRHDAVEALLRWRR